MALSARPLDSIDGCYPTHLQLLPQAAPAISELPDPVITGEIAFVYFPCPADEKTGMESVPGVVFLSQTGTSI